MTRLKSTKKSKSNALSSVKQRPRRVAELIQSQLGFLIKKEVNDPRLSTIAITKVQVSDDLSVAKIFYTVLDATKVSDTDKAFEKASGYLRTLLAHATALRHVPRLTFAYDTLMEKGADLSELIDKAVEDDLKKGT